jgi:UDP-N-acetylglucosamine diphosphorylase/glucosamine-1-phosphate N-acetyltransferase
MNELQLILYDDRIARNWFPFSLTRPVGELLHGAFTMRRRWEAAIADGVIGHVTDTALAGFAEPGAATVLDLRDIDTQKPRLFLNSRAVPAIGFPSLIRSGERMPDQFRIGDALVGIYCAPGQANPEESLLLDGATSSGQEVPGKLLNSLWDLMSGSSAQLSEDIMQLYGSPNRWSSIPSRVTTLGPNHLVLENDAVIEPGVILDFRSGPIVVMHGAQVRAYTRLTGPVLVGPHSTILGGRISGSSIGPHCKVHGELEETVILGYSNKAHDGFIGHSYIGSWVNLGAFTTNSDLKNNYGSVRLWTPAGDVDTGEMKIGCFLGDHVKTAIGTLINTGTVVGPGSNIFDGMPPKFVPPFSWGSKLGEHEFEKFAATAKTAMNRRSVPLPESHRELLRRAWQRGRALSRAHPQ